MVEPGRSAATREAKPCTAMKSKPSSKPEKEKAKEKETSKKQTSGEPESPSYRLALKSLFSCRNSHAHHHHHHAPGSTKCKKLGCSASICNLKDNPRVMQRPEEAAPPEPCKRRASVSACNSSTERFVKKPLSELNVASASKQAPPGASLSSTSSSSTGGSFRGMQLRRLSGCYECHHMVVDPISGVFREGSMRATISSCPDCGEIFVRAESLELHQSIRHAVSELGPEDTSRNIIEIIFQSSWLKKHTPVCKIDRILKVHNTAKTLARFEDYRDSVKAKASKLAKKHPRCTADGNELLRFHCAALACSLGLHGATHLCDAAVQGCAACGVIRDGFKTAGADGGIRTMATSGRAHDDAVGEAAADGEEQRKAMLVCRVIAGRVKRGQDAAAEEYDSVAGSAGVYSNLDELVVFNPRAILPCFVVVYKA